MSGETERTDLLERVLGFKYAIGSELIGDAF
jgi:hypothetical protein